MADIYILGILILVGFVIYHIGSGYGSSGIGNRGKNKGTKDSDSNRNG